MVLVALFMGSQMAIFAQGKKEGKTDRKQFGQEQMQKMHMNKKRIILIAVAAVIIVGGGVWLFGGAKAKHKGTYATATILSLIHILPEGVRSAYQIHRWNLTPES